MKLWRLSDPCDYRYGRAGRVGGTWQKGEYMERRRALAIVWLPDSDAVGDFTWPGLDTDVVVTDRVGAALADVQIEGYELKPVEMAEDSEAAVRRSRKPRVRLPYSGPPLWDLWVTAWTRIDRKRSTVAATRTADGSETFELRGVQRRESSWDKERRVLVKRMHPRVEGQGLFVPPIRGFFRVSEFPAWIFCTDDIKDLIEDHCFTNVSFLEMGDVLEPDGSR